MSFFAPGPAFGPTGATPQDTSPLIVVFERDDTIAVPLLSQLRLANYDVRSARTPVELFDLLQKLTVAMILVDLSGATASRREFWVALDAYRRGRSTQVVTFRQTGIGRLSDSELGSQQMTLADIEISGPWDVPALVTMIRQRVPLSGAAFTLLNSGSATTAMPGGGFAPLGPFGPVLGMPGSPFASVAPAGGVQYPAWTPPSTSSPFAQPAAVNPFGDQSTGSPFARPDSSNPFGAVPAHHDLSPHKSPRTGGLAATRLQPVEAQGDTRESQRGAAPGAGGSAPFSAEFGTPSRGIGIELPTREVADAWSPPDGAGLPFAQDAQIDPFGARSAPAATASQSDLEWPTQPVDIPADRDFPLYDMQLPRVEAPPPMDEPSVIPEHRIEERHREDTTTPVRFTVPAGSQLPIVSGGLTRPEDRALGAVLVEGALLTPQKLEVLKGIRHMLSTVEMDFKLGELALLFRFLSPDQLLAALLVSRGLVSPQQIAALGQIKQELGATGINYDLETLLTMFHILSHDELDRLRAELA